MTSPQAQPPAPPSAPPELKADQSAVKKPGRKKFIVPVLLVLALATGTGIWLNGRHLESTDDAYLGSDITPIAAKVPGHVVEIAILDHQPVKQGDVLIRLDPRDFEARLAEARAALETAKAELALAGSKLALQETSIRQAGAEVQSAQADTTRTKRDFERSSQLVKEDFVSKSRFDATQADAAKAGALLSRARAGADGERRRLSVVQAERAAAEARLKQAEAGLAQAELDLSHTLIRSPIDGRAGNRSSQPGQYVRTGQQLMVVVPVDRVWVDANFKETQIGRMRPGQPAFVKIDAFPGQVLEGRVDSLAPASGARFSLLPPENATGNFTKVVQRVPVRIALPASHPLSGELRPGMSAVVTVEVDAKK
jgi:membrane fusion protein (multidrug efflux system)